MMLFVEERIQNTNMDKKGIIFDLDGVIVSTDKLHYQAWKRMADELGVYFDEEINNRLRGVSRMESLEIILERYKGEELNQKQKEVLAEKKNSYYRELLCTLKPEDVTDEVRETLEKLKEKGYQIAIGSSSKNAAFILKQVQLSDSFDAVSDGNNVVNSKPDPEVFLKAAEYLSLTPEECVVVEDAYSGIDAAKAADMYAVATGDAAAYKKADRKLYAFSDLVTLF